MNIDPSFTVPLRAGPLFEQTLLLNHLVGVARLESDSYPLYSLTPTPQGSVCIAWEMSNSVMGSPDSDRDFP